MTFMLISKTLRHQKLNRLTQHGRSIIAKQRFCLRIHENNFALGIDDDNCIRSRFQKASEFLFRPFSLCNVAYGAADECPLLRLERAQTDFDWELLAVLP